MLFREDIDSMGKINRIIDSVAEVNDLFESIQKLTSDELSTWSHTFITKMMGLYRREITENDEFVSASKCMIRDKLLELAAIHTVKELDVEEKDKMVYMLLTDRNPTNRYYMSNEELKNFYNELEPTNEFYEQFKLGMAEIREEFFNTVANDRITVMKNYLDTADVVLGDLLSRYDIAKDYYGRLNNCYKSLPEFK